MIAAPRLMVVISAMFIIAGSRFHGQILHASGPLPSFEVATIKPGPPNVVGIQTFGPRGADRFLAINVTVKDLIDFAYTTDDDRQIVGLSSWMTSKRWNIDAKVGDAEVAAMSRLPLSYNPYRFMTQSLLADRFKLKVHFETRLLPVYELVVAKDGPKLTVSEMNPTHPGETVKPRSLKMGAGRASGEGSKISAIVEVLEKQAEVGNAPGGRGRTVVDRTNLVGLYDWTLRWTPWQETNREESPTLQGPSLFTALQEQLGLKLQPAKDKVEVVVINHIDFPSEN